MASEPYWADAPSRRISSDLTAMDGIELRSGPCEPNANSVSPPWYTWTSAERFMRSEEHTSELQSRRDLVCRLLLEKKKKKENSLLIIHYKNIKTPSSTNRVQS